MRAVISPDGRAYPYAGMGNASPDAATQIPTGYSIITYAYATHEEVYNSKLVIGSLSKSLSPVRRTLSNQIRYNCGVVVAFREI
jgi:hypothetical protein